MTRREQFVLLFLAGSVLVGAAVVARNMAYRDPPGSLRIETGTADPAPVGEPGAGADSSENADAEPLAAEPKTLPETTVSVLGAVRKPGVYRLPAGSRVDDILQAARGANADADLSDINLAAPLIDGSTLTIPAKPSEPAGGRSRSPRGATNAARYNPPEYSISRWRGDSESAGAGGSAGQGSAGIGAGGLINVNTASQGQLESLPGVGPVKAGAIIRYRAESRFATKADLMNVSGIGPKTYENIEPLVTVR